MLHFKEISDEYLYRAYVSHSTPESHPPSVTAFFYYFLLFYHCYNSAVSIPDFVRFIPKYYKPEGGLGVLK